MSEEDRRKNDETFKLKVVEQNARLEAMLKNVEQHLEKLDDVIQVNSFKIADIQYALHGGPKPDDIGLFEKHRIIVRNWAIAVTVFSIILKFGGDIAKDALSKWINPQVHAPATKKTRAAQRE